MRRYLLLLLLAALAAPAAGQWSNDPHQNTLVAENGERPQMVSDGAGGAVISWYSFDGGYVRLQRLDREGFPRWEPLGLPVAGYAHHQIMDYHLTAGTPGHYLVACVSYTPTGMALYAQKLDSLGHRLWGEPGALAAAVDSMYIAAPKIISDGYGGAFLIWQDARSGANEVYAQRVDAQGQAQWAATGISLSGPTGTGSMINTLISGGDGYAIIKWYESPISNWVQRIDLDGNLLWGTQGLQMPFIYQELIPAIAGESIGAAFIPTSSPYWNLRSQLINTMGNGEWGDSGVQVCDTVNIQAGTRCKLTFNPSGTYYLWRSGPGNDFSIYLQKVDMEGEVQWSPSGLLLSGPQTYGLVESIISVGLNLAVASWSEDNTQSLVAYKFDDQGSPLWQSGKITLGYYDFTYWSFSSVDDQNGGAIFSWFSHPSDIFAQQVSANGNLGEVLGIADPNLKAYPTTLSLLPCFPNPFNESATIPMLIPGGLREAPVICLINMLGQTVFQFPAEKLSPGLQYLHWDGRNDTGPVASGKYFIVLKTDNASSVMPLVKLR